ncbi:hypothetical protein HYS50_01995 [Candidatus Woesearchaeota archaeon]|nr:hypothetical protein [Candidatus Woesearchaeota archaeon]
MVDAREGLLEREKEIIRLLHILLDLKLDFIVVGGYAVATYKKRFSVDLDLVIKEEDLQKFEALCLKEGYIAGYDKDIHILYGEKFKRYVKTMKGYKVYIDFLINGLVSRSTDATWGFEYVKKHATKGTVEGVEFPMPERELLIAMKFHAGRLGDMRDIVALMPCDMQKLEKHITKGDRKKLMENMNRQEKFLKKPQFDDSFKGIFGVRVYNHKDVEETVKVMATLQEKWKRVQKG